MFESKMLMGQEEWRELCKKQGSSMWSMIIQLLQFAAKEDPDEFRRRRDGIAEALFSPELSGRRLGQSSHNLLETAGNTAEEMYVPSGWESHSAVSAATDGTGVESRKDSSQVTPPWTQSSPAGDAPEDRQLPGAGYKRQSQPGQAAPKSSGCLSEGAFQARVSESHSAEAPLQGSSTKSEFSRQDAPGNCGEPSPSNRIKSSHHRCPPSQNFHSAPVFTEHPDKRHHGAREEKHRIHGTGARSGPLAPSSEPPGPAAQSTGEQHGDEEGHDDVCAAIEHAMDELESEEALVKRIEDAKASLARKDLPAADILVTLRAFTNVPISVAILESTQIGRAVSKVSKRSKDPEVQSLAANLIRDWKELVAKAYEAAPTLSKPSAAKEAEEATLAADAFAAGAEGCLGSWLPAPPLEEEVFQLDIHSDLGLANCFQDIDSIGSELSGSVASAGGGLTTKTPESHRMFGTSESSPCETNRPSGSGVGGSHPQSVLSESVRKAGWNDCELRTGRHIVGESIKNSKEQMDCKPIASEGKSTPLRQVTAEMPRQQNSRQPLERPPSVPQGTSLGPEIKKPELHRPGIPRPLPPLSAERLELSKRRLQERNQELGEAKKFKCIQMLDTTDSQPKAKFRPGTKSSHSTLNKGGSRFNKRM